MVPLRSATIRICASRSNIVRLIRPISAPGGLGNAPLGQPVCERVPRSWRRHETPVSSPSGSQPRVISVACASDRRCPCAARMSRAPARAVGKQGGIVAAALHDLRVAVGGKSSHGGCKKPCQAAVGPITTARANGKRPQADRPPAGRRSGNGLLKQLTKAWLERALNVERIDHPPAGRNRVVVPASLRQRATTTFTAGRIFPSSGRANSRLLHDRNISAYQADPFFFLAPAPYLF